jgi:lipopolysaccharide/colanic/teichoic acid biosynthesis glycosyltransferase
MQQWVVIERRHPVKLYRPRYQKIKRALELLLCFLAAPVLVPIAFLIAIAIRWNSPGPIFFVQDRVGKGGRPFKIIKFRTMHHNIDKEAHRTFMKEYINGRIAQPAGEKEDFKPFQPNQVTKVGRILRKTSLDELPQLINVFRGEMSIVGPRPNVPWEVEEYQGWHQERLEVLPGITGLAQVKGRSNIVFNTIVQYDIEYIKKQSLALDLKILWWTVTSVFLSKGAR